jgi:hypothetical protein
MLREKGRVEANAEERGKPHENNMWNMKITAVGDTRFFKGSGNRECVHRCIAAKVGKGSDPL